ncbi:MAG: hypothetical protein Q4F49_08825 [Pseudoxanthomonas suwonensis]|nr:hypothetical protein [Pseudoxanthomonas suwonensis]
MRVSTAVRLSLLLLAVLLLAACATSRPLVTGTQRAPIDPALVQVYYTAPQVPYEEVARLEVNSGAFSFGDQAKTNAIIDRLRRQAASLGANGVILLGTADGHGGTGVSVGGGAGRGSGGWRYSGAGVGVTISPSQRHGTGIAIHMPQPPAATQP